MECQSDEHNLASQLFSLHSIERRVSFYSKSGTTFSTIFNFAFFVTAGHKRSTEI
jgi:glucose-6-phosphate isomerase